MRVLFDFFINIARWACVCHFVVSVVVERMYDWSRTNRCFELTKHVSVVVERMYDWSWIPSSSIPLAVLSFSCCWKDVRLKHLRRSATYRLSSFQLLLKGCTIEAAAPSHISLTNKVSVVVERMYDWSSTATKRHPYKVSVVVERMYDWSLWCDRSRHNHFIVSVVVERMYDWSRTRQRLSLLWIAVSVVVERMYDWSFLLNVVSPLPLSFSCCWKDVRLKLHSIEEIMSSRVSFSCCWKDVRLKLRLSMLYVIQRWVSVVVERMYDWSSETNWLKTNDFWQLVSDLFFENGRSAQKVPLFSKIWGDLGDCLTVFDSCSNI